MGFHGRCIDICLLLSRIYRGNPQSTYDTWEAGYVDIFLKKQLIVTYTYAKTYYTLLFHTEFFITIYFIIIIIMGILLLPIRSRFDTFWSLRRKRRWSNKTLKCSSLLECGNVTDERLSKTFHSPKSQDVIWHPNDNWMVDEASALGRLTQYVETPIRANRTQRKVSDSMLTIWSPCYCWNADARKLVETA